MDLATAKLRVINIIQSQDINLDNFDDSLGEAIEEAVNKYGDDRPLDDVDALDGNDTQIIDMPGTFALGFSELKSVEYPTGNNPPTILGTDEYGVYRNPDDSLELRLYNATPPTSETVNITFTTYNSDIASVRDSDLNAVLQLAAYFAVIREAHKASNTTSDCDALDFVDHTTTASRYETQAQTFKANYDNHMFGDSDAAQRLGDTEHSSSNGQWETESRFNQPRIFHKDDDG